MINGNITTLPELIQAINQELRSMQTTRKGDLDMKGQRVTNVAASRGPRDLVTRSEAQERAMYETDAGHHVAHSTIIAKDGVRSKTLAVEGDDLVPLRQVKALVGASGDSVLTTNVDQTVDGHKLFKAVAFPRNSITCANGANNNVSFENPSITGGFLYITGPTSAFSISGFRRHLSAVGGLNGQIIVVFNSTNVSMTLLHMINGTGSDDSNRMRLANNSNIIVGANGSVMLIYADLPGKWVNVARI